MITDSELRESHSGRNTRHGIAALLRWGVNSAMEGNGCLVRDGGEKRVLGAGVRLSWSFGDTACPVLPKKVLQSD